MGGYGKRYWDSKKEEWINPANEAVSERSDLLYSVFSKLEWKEGECDEEETDPYEGGNPKERKYLCLIDISYFAGRTMHPEPYFEVCYMMGGSWMSDDDLGICGPVKYVRAWTRI